VFPKAICDCVNTFDLAQNHRFVDLDRVVEDIVAVVYDQHTRMTSHDYRVPPLALMRFARGGKTETISRAFDRLKKDGRVHPILISFNGSGIQAIRRREGETQSEAILRLIAIQLGFSTTRTDCCFVVDRMALDRHIGENAVLLI
jgi:hypothetical protein